MEQQAPAGCWLVRTAEWAWLVGGGASPWRTSSISCQSSVVLEQTLAEAWRLRAPRRRPRRRCSAAPLWQPQKRPTPVFASTLSQWKRLAAHRKFKGTFLISDKAPQLNGSTHILMDVTG